MTLVDPSTQSLPHRVRSFVAPPSNSIRSYLVRGELLLHVDAPALNAFVIDELPTIAGTVIVGVAAVV
uniref:hypothetical protein n=1 Tax=Escherichia coli TaxID=562 RepID=UPI0022AC2125